MLEGYGVRLEPLHETHAQALRVAVADGDLWKLWFTAVPRPEEIEAYITTALSGERAGHMQPWAVRDLATGSIVGSTRYHDIISDAERVEIGYTWYARSLQGTKINPACKLLLMRHAFETLRAAVVGFRTDPFNFRSQRAIERLGAKKDGVIRHHQRRRNGTARDTVMYSIVSHEWPDVQRNLLYRLGEEVA